MEKKREYNEVYGFMPVDIVNKLSQADRQRMFLNWIEREPTETGWFITKVAIKALGEDFLEYIFKNILETLDADKDDSEEVIDIFTTILKGFASDINTLYEYIDNYREEKGELHLVDNPVPSAEPKKKCDIKVEEDPEDQVISEKKSTGRRKKSTDPKKKSTKKLPGRDSRGRFLKK